MTSIAPMKSLLAFSTYSSGENTQKIPFIPCRTEYVGKCFRLGREFDVSGEVSEYDGDGGLIEGEEHVAEFCLLISLFFLLF